METDRTIQRGQTVLLLSYLCFYAVQAIYSTYFNLYLDSVGFTKTQMGAVSSAATLFVLLVQPFWGVRSDKAKSKNRIVRLLLFGSGLAALCFYVSTSYAFIWAVNCLFCMLFNPLTPLLDNITMESSLQSHSFGSIRVGGTVGYCISVLVTGQLLQQRYQLMFFFIALLLWLGLLCFSFVPPVRGGLSAPKTRGGSLAPLKEKSLLGLLALVILFQLSSYNFHSFYPLYFQSFGGNSLLIGTMMFFSALSELPMWFCCGKLLRKFGIRKLAVASCLLTALRWFVLYTTTSTLLAIAINLTHGFSFVMLQYSLVTMINERTPAHLHATAQSTANMLITLFSRIVGGVLSGWICDRWGMRQMMLFNLLITLAGLFFIFFLEPSRQVKRETAAGTRIG